MLKFPTIALCTLVAASSFAQETQTHADNEAQRIYDETCQICHDQGVESAPRPGVPEDWQYRLEYGREDVYLNAIEGLGAKMPPRGACAVCSDEQIRAVVDIMLTGLDT